MSKLGYYSFLYQAVNGHKPIDIEKELQKRKYYEQPKTNDKENARRRKQIERQKLNGKG